MTFRSLKPYLAAAAIAATATLLAGCAGGGGDAGPAETADPNEKVTLDFAFWGNDVRADLYTQVIDAFEEEHPNITVNESFLGFPEFWEKRQTEAAGGGLPDVMQFDYSYLRQYAENGLLLDLTPYLGEAIQTDPIDEKVLDIGKVADGQFAVPISTNAWGLYTNPKLLETVGVEEFAGGSWEDYTDWMAQVSEAGGGTVFGGTDYTGRIQNFEIQLRAHDKFLFSEEGELGFTEDDLKAFWEDGDAVRASGGVVGSQKLEEIYPLSAFDSAITASELTWDNFGGGYLGNLGEGYTELGLIAPPVTVEGAKDLYQKPSMLHAASAKTDHPAEAAMLIDFLINDPITGEVFGTNRGLPASETALSGATLEGLDAQIQEYEASIADRLGDAPPVPVIGYGSIEEEFRLIGQELGHGTISVDDAVKRLMDKIDITLNG
ncbi:ABC transporter substrate-binding protein [Microbacterium stercoris]|uniref:Extracellular solute-binding protein n=1 Tax=Microbacterium stercoris TaxID=2820289 RepID=A0A939TWG8_9MICO|nr:extracellular solute-binding protein [Microbacterium stercoris]MBO3662642.1 extracellular solute-binding protein [Microbacterium stercoris]